MSSETERIMELKKELQSKFGHLPNETRIIRSPYRICPLGAHVDHQHGLVTGMCIDRNVLLVYAPNNSGHMRLISKNFEGEVNFSVDENLQPINKHWGNYAKGAMVALKSRFNIKYGIDGIIHGNLPIGGLSSSAAVGLAYLLALEQVNEIEIPIEENIHLNQKIENDFIGLKNGILDQSTILLSQKNKLFYLDCQNKDYCLISPAESLPHFKIIVVYSGVAQNLAGTSYNQRVTECEEATRLLLNLAGMHTNNHHVLRDIPVDIFHSFKQALPENPRKRAAHFFTEVERVTQGLVYWRNGDLINFGRLINESGQSSIENYECGCDHLITIYKILSGLDGVYGTRFSGAGFRGSCIGLIDPQYETAIIEKLRQEYPKRHPDIQDKYEIFICNSEEGARLLCE